MGHGDGRYLPKVIRYHAITAIRENIVGHQTTLKKYFKLNKYLK